MMMREVMTTSRPDEGPSIPGRTIRIVFWSWMLIGLAMMIFYRVPEGLSFSNGLFLVFFGLYTFSLLLQAEQAQAAIKPWRLALLAAIVGSVTMFAEWLGTKTGFPFGHYVYTDVLRLGPWEVPIPIGFAWVGVVGSALLISRARTKAGRALEVGLYALWFDLILDPVAYSREFWIWLDQGSWGAYYGIPTQNFISWFVLAALLSMMFPMRQVRGRLHRESHRLYAGMCLMFGLLGFKEGLWGPVAMAVAAAIAMEWRARRD
ncbi:carotenoid biosynthesis protein [Paenibacillus sp. 1P07SE]|uniref:carotenoid biosynthesis protein n=1 Tax=Paenibacillus sp. 1P07SE TaxID=3132209 RepID=UPI0039A46676